MTIETPSVLVRMSPEVIAELEADGWEFGQADADGFHTPTLHATDESGWRSDAERLVEAANAVLFAARKRPVTQLEEQALSLLDSAADALGSRLEVAPTTVGGNDR